MAEFISLYNWVIFVLTTSAQDSGREAFENLGIYRHRLIVELAPKKLTTSKSDKRGSAVFEIRVDLGSSGYLSIQLIARRRFHAVTPSV
ncbi:hypothetical protein AG1IA_01933 [Rhizoctonia solani AG-1 IA]|uniref:Uncharacterized protein n=1 Tax=Thanatephorus cucumeris (strain AG1-IA) TaxID=983506 RepID=L8X1C6_THACA|nr:hypothetical protein AG1IA_01933 [Rhizoctonia solani AG-1 IA]